MHITNADGSVPEMCGNGLRCVALFLADSDGTRQDVDQAPVVSVMASPPVMTAAAAGSVTV